MMKYIQKVILFNFQSHKYSEIEFDNGLNIIVGPSDSGKTAILRAIKWALFNEPSGDYFIREGESECSVEVVFSDDTRVKRYRSKSKNLYYLYDNLNNEMKFEGFGTSVPEEIIEATGIKKIFLDSDTSKSINLSDQLEGAFLLSERPSTRANSIGRLVGVNIIDDALRDSLRDVRNLSNNKKIIDEKINNLEDELIEYEYLDNLKIKIDKIQLLRDKISNNIKLLSDYQSLLRKYKLIIREKESLNHELKKLKNLDTVLTIYHNTDKYIGLYSNIKRRINELNQIKLYKKYNLEISSSLKYIDTVETNIKKIESLIHIVTNLLILQSKYISIKSEIRKLSIISKKLNSVNEVLNAPDEISNNLQLLNKLLKIKENNISLKKRLAIGINYVEKLKTVDNIPKILYDIDHKYSKLNKLNQLLNNYNIIRKEIITVSNYYKRYENDASAYINKYKELLQQLEVCPLCLSTIDEDKIGHIISHYN